MAYAECIYEYHVTRQIAVWRRADGLLPILEVVLFLSSDPIPRPIYIIICGFVYVVCVLRTIFGKKLKCPRANSG